MNQKKNKPTPQIRNVLLGTPCQNSQANVWFVNSVIHAVRVCAAHNIYLNPVFFAYDASPCVRNDIIHMAVEDDYDDLLFIDADMEFNPQWMVDLLSAEVDVVGGTARKKTDAQEAYVVKTRNLKKEANGLIKVESLGTGFVRLSKHALKAVYDTSKAYKDGDKTRRMVCSVEIVDGELYGEDTMLFKRLHDLNFDIWLNPAMTCNHIGMKKYVGDFNAFASRLTGLS